VKARKGAHYALRKQEIAYKPFNQANYLWLCW